MRKITILLSLLLGFASIASSQTYFNENFESGALPEGWVIETKASDGGFKFGESSNFQNQYWEIPDNGGKFAASIDAICNCDKSEDYLITKTVDLSDASIAYLSFDYILFDAGQNLNVMFSKDNGQSWSGFLQVSQTALPYTENVWNEEYEVNVGEALGNSNVKFAFHYDDNGDWTYGTVIDNVRVFVPDAKNDAGLVSLDLKLNHKTNIGILIDGQLRNYSTDTLKTIKLKWNDGTNEKSEELTGLSVPPLHIYNYEFTEKVIYQETGEYIITVSIESVNGKDDEDAENNSLQMDIVVWDDFAERNVLVEEFSTEQCPNCPPVALYLKEITEESDNAIMLVHHVGFGTDQYTIKESNELLDFYGGQTYAPAAMFDRHYNGMDNDDYEGIDPGPVFWPGTPYGGNKLNERLDKVSMVNVSIEGVYDEELGVVKATVSGDFVADYTDQLGVSLWVKEDDIASYGQAGWKPELWFHHAVARDAVSDPLGDIIQSQTNAGGSFTKSYTFDVGADWELGNVSLIGFVNNMNEEDINKRSVENAASLKFDVLQAGVLNTCTFRVRDGSTDDLLQGVDIEVSEELFVTNSIGEAYSSFVEDGVIEYTVIKDGFESHSASVDVSSSELVEVTLMPVGVAFEELFEMKVYPNPTKGLVQVFAKDIHDVAIYSLAGKLLISSAYDNADNANISLEGLEDGVYLVSVNTSKGQRMERIIKQ